ncbi:MAG: helix-turn-helix transcriptional regulator [Cytophagales bacterium]|nr:helix-turn-helix transcriptional regulator [Armatimonadota bacterium]
MDWLERLNRLPGRIALPREAGGGTGSLGGAVDIAHWAHSLHLPDNVPHRHAYFEVCRVGARGQGQYRVEGTPHEIGPGDLFFSRPGVLHQIVNAGPPLMELFWVTFHLQFPAESPGDDAMTAFFRRFAGASETLVASDTGGSVRAAWDALYATASETSAPLGGPIFAAQANALILALLIALAAAGGGAESVTLPPETTPDADEKAGQRAVQFIHDNLGRPLPVPEIAARVGLSPRHLTRLVIRFTGVPPAVYIETARIQRARTLLLRTDDPIKQVGTLVGYEDVHHFTRVFSRTVGCPPGVFRRTRGSAAAPVKRGSEIQTPGTLI